MSIRLRPLTTPDRRMEQRIRRIAELARRRDRILETPELDLPALAALVADYEAAGLLCAAAELRRRLEHYSPASSCRTRRS